MYTFLGDYCEKREDGITIMMKRVELGKYVVSFWGFTWKGAIGFQSKDFEGRIEAFKKYCRLLSLSIDEIRMEK